MSRLPKLGILGSGSGSNCQSIYDAIQSGSLRAEIAVVMSDNPDAYILTGKKQYGVDCVCLAGFMRLVKLPLLKEFPSRILNIHPSLLPAFPGLHAWEQAVNAGAAESGCTVHYVDDGMDTGPILGQARVPVLPGDTPESLHARIQEQEHTLYPAMIARVLETLA